MLVLQITGIKDFMSKLFLRDTFDSFYLVEASIITATTFVLDGRLQKDYYSSEELEDMEETDYSTWETLKGFCFQLIKGKKLPLSMKFVFRLTSFQAKQLLQQSGLSYTSHDVDGFFFNIRYENGSATLTSGISMKTFTLDKSLEQYWERILEDFIKRSEIEAE